MKNLLLLTAALTLVLTSAATAGGTGAQDRSTALCPVTVVTLTAVQGFSEIVDVVPQVARVEGLTLNVRTDALGAAVTVETERGPRFGVVATVVRALGKALLKVVASVIQRVV